MAALVVLKGVCKSYGRLRAVVSVSATIEAGSSVIIEGPNGSGKSTLLGIVGTLVRPTSGEITYPGFGASEVRTQIGWLGHDTLCYPDLSGRENVELGLRLTGVSRSYDEIAARFGLAAFGERPVRTYSRGQKQRIALARALLNEPKLLLLDEPSTGLDTAARKLCAQIVREEATRGATVVTVTHDVDFAGEIGGARWRIDRGRLVA